MTVAASLFHATAGIEFIWDYAGAKQLDSRLPIAKFRIAGSRPCNDPGMLGRKARHQAARSTRRRAGLRFSGYDSVFSLFEGLLLPSRA